MKTTKIITTCDMCGKSIPLESCSTPYVLAKIEFLSRIGSRAKVITDVCDKCNEKLFSFLQQEDMLNHAQDDERWEPDERWE